MMNMYYFYLTQISVNCCIGVKKYLKKNTQRLTELGSLFDQVLIMPAHVRNWVKVK